MSTVILTRNDQGKIEGLGEKGARAWGKFQKKIKEMDCGETLSFTFKFPRSPRFHKFHFAMLGQLFDAQEQFDDEDVMRKWSEIGAGYCIMVPGPNGRMCAMPDSIAYERLDDEEFRVVHNKVKAFLRSARAQSFLWAHLKPSEASNMVEGILAGFD